MKFVILDQTLTADMNSQQLKGHIKLAFTSPTNFFTGDTITIEFVPAQIIITGPPDR